MDDYFAIIDTIRKDAEDAPPVVEVVTVTVGSTTFNVPIEGNA